MKPVITVQISEGLGNQMFMYANAFSVAKRFGYKLFIDNTSELLKLIGVNINTSPVLDLRVKGSSNIIGDRSFSHNPTRLILGFFL